ncbi:MAG: response regulator transcription factor [Chloroflexi bacterium]|nr:response regulator transcription factor [Chloroflexota bacterium]
MTTLGETIQIVIVDDHPLFREGVASILRNQMDIDVIGEGESADEAFRLCSQMLPDVLLLDINIPGGGLSVIAKIATACPVTKSSCSPRPTLRTTFWQPSNPEHEATFSKVCWGRS